MNLNPFKSRTTKPLFRMQGEGDSGDSSNFIGELAEQIASQYLREGDISGPSGFRGFRDNAIRFSPIVRATTVISSLVAQMVASMSLSVRDGMDRKVENERTRACLRLLRHSPDMGITPGHMFIEDAMQDYLLDGNALIRVMYRGNTREPEKLIRYEPEKAHTSGDEMAAGPLVYYAIPSLSYESGQDMIPAREMAHVRWPFLWRSRAMADRNWFAPSPVALLRREIVTGITAEMYAQLRFRKAPLTQLLVNYEYDAKANLKADARKQILRQLANIIANEGMLPIFGGRNTQEISASPVHEHTNMSRSYQVETIARFYGLPLPLLSVPVGQWSRGINEQVMKMAWRTCIQPHMSRLLSALKLKMLMPNEMFIVDPTELVRGDASGISEMITAMNGDAQRNPIASRAEMRRMAGLPSEPEEEIEETLQPKTEGGEMTAMDSSS